MAVGISNLEEPSGVSDFSGSGSENDDELLRKARDIVIKSQLGSTSMLQRKFSIGFQRASRLLDMMEERAIVGPRDGPRPRDVLVNPMEVEALFGGTMPRYDVGATITDEEMGLG